MKINNKDRRRSGTSTSGASASRSRPAEWTRPPVGKLSCGYALF